MGVRTPNAGQNNYFQRFLCEKAKKCKKYRNLLQNLAKKLGVLSLHQYDGGLYNYHYSGIGHCMKEILWENTKLEKERLSSFAVLQFS